VVVQVCFALFPIFAKFAFGRGGSGGAGAFTPFSITVWRIAFGSASLLGAAFLLHGRAALPRPRDLPALFACSFLGVTANMALYLEGLSRSTATNAGLMMCLIPVFTFAIAAATKQEPFERRRALGVLVVLVGAALLQGHAPHEIVVGNGLMVLNTLCYAIYLVTSRPLLARYPPLVLIAWVFALGLPFAPWFARGQTLVPAAPATAWWAFGLILVFATSLPYMLNAWALARVRASTTAIFIYLQPLITAAAGTFVLGERPGRRTLGSALFVFAGMWLVARCARTDAPEPAGA